MCRACPFGWAQPSRRGQHLYEAEIHVLAAEQEVAAGARRGREQHVVPRASGQLRRARRTGSRRGARPLGCGVLAVQQRQQVNTTATVGGGCGLNGDKLKQGKEGSGRGAHSELGGAVEEAGVGLE